MKQKPQYCREDQQSSSWFFEIKKPNETDKSLEKLIKKQKRHKQYIKEIKKRLKLQENIDNSYMAMILKAKFTIAKKIHLIRIDSVRTKDLE